MEEEKAAAYYDELRRKGEGAARLKQGLGFSSSTKNSSFRSNFVKASSNNSQQSDNENKKATLETIQTKLNKKPTSSSSRRRIIHSSKRDRDRDRDTDTDTDRSRKRPSTRSRSGSPRPRTEREVKERVDYAKLIQDYHYMTPAERVKAKMKLQLDDTAKKDVAIGTGAGWERFDFDKDAPLDDEEVEAADDDAALVKRIGKSFRFSTVEARREEQIKAAHDEAMFGAPVLLPLTVADAVAGAEPDSEDHRKESSESIPATSFLSEKILAKQQGSWRDRARKVMDGGSTS